MEKQMDIQRRDNLYGFEFREEDGRRSEERKTYNIKQLWQRNHEILNLVSQGLNHNLVAEIVGVTPACVSQTVNSDLGKAKLSEIRQDRDDEAKKNYEKIRVLTAKALLVYHEILDNETGEATLKERKDVSDTVVLELSGLRVPTKVQGSYLSTTLTKEELEEFKDRGRKAIEQSGKTIDITSIPIGNDNEVE